LLSNTSKGVLDAREDTLLIITVRKNRNLTQARYRLRHLVALAIPVLAILAVVVTARANAASNSPQRADANQLLADSLRAVGGQERLEAIKGMTLTATRATAINAVASSDEAPPMIFDRVTDQMDFGTRMLKETSSLNFTGLSADINTISIYTPEGGYTDSAGSLAPLDPTFVYRAEDLFLTHPLLALLSAAQDQRAELGKADSVAGFSCTWVAFTAHAVPMKTCINNASKLPVALEIKRDYPQDDYAALWGTFVTRYTFTNWTIEPNGVFFPRTWREETGHGENSVIYVQNIVFSMKAAAPIHVPDNFKQAFAKTMARTPTEQAAENHGTGEPQELGDGVYVLPGKLYLRNVLLVRQSDGIVIVEAPVSPENSAYVRKQATKLFPGAKIKALISTDNIWGHVAGVAGYGDAGVSLYVLDRNVDLVARLLEAGGAKSGSIRAVAAKTTIGSGTNAVEVIPYRTAYGAKMMAVYLPDQKLLWASDLFLPKPWQPEFQTEHLWEIRSLIDREQLAVERVMGDHRPPEEWAVVVKEIPEGV
jgi:hypothetical protein